MHIFKVEHSFDAVVIDEADYALNVKDLVKAFRGFRFKIIYIDACSFESFLASDMFDAISMQASMMGKLTASIIQHTEHQKNGLLMTSPGLRKYNIGVKRFIKIE